MNENKEKQLPNPLEANSKKVKNQKLTISDEKKFLLSFKSGLFAFSIVLIFFSLGKVLAFATGEISVFTITSNEIGYSMWAFILFSFIDFISHFKS